MSDSSPAILAASTASIRDRVDAARTDAAGTSAPQTGSFAQTLAAQGNTQTPSLSQTEPERDALVTQAEGKLKQLAEKLVADTWFKPMLAAIRKDPLRSDLFHGGFAEDAFSDQLDTVLADRMTSSASLPVTERIVNDQMNWLRHQPIDQIRNVARMNVDMLG